MDLPPSLSPANLPRALEARVPLKAVRDMKNRLLFGHLAPRSDECIFVDPRRVRQSYIARRDRGAPNFGRRHSGMVLGGDWDRSVQSFDGGIKERACLVHFRDGVPWSETGIYEHLLADIDRKGTADGCQSLEELEARYRRLDQLFEEIRRTGRLKPRRELNGYFRREHGGIYIHIARDGTPIRAGGGIHRLAMARILGLPRIPAQLGVIHREAFDDGVLEVLRTHGQSG